MSDILAPFEAMLDRLFPPARVRAIDAGDGWLQERTAVEELGVSRLADP